MVQFSVEMGQQSSVPKSRRKKSFGMFQSRSFTTHKNLSHTFNINDTDQKLELININSATEEDLMTLDGVNREVARNIVEHRKAIGRYRKVEDLALVTGIGAEKLERIRPEICVMSRRNTHSPSRAHSCDSLKSTDSRSTIKSNKLVNINRASVFELQTVNSVTQEIAAAIVNYREKKGPFKQVGDLKKVKCIDYIRLDTLCRYLTVEDNEIEVTEVDSPQPVILTNGFTICSDRRLNGGPVKFPLANGLSSSTVGDIFELLSAYSPRPIVEEVFRYNRNNEPAVRIASWNLENCSYEKASNLGVLEVICRTILENGWSILAVQSVDVVALRTICEELNNPKLRRVEEWRDKKHNWNFCMLDETSYLGFIYDSEGAVNINLLTMNQGLKNLTVFCEILIVNFRIDNLEVQIVNMKLKNQVKYDELKEQFKDLVSEGTKLIVCVDFNNILDDKESLYSYDFLHPALPKSMNTNYLPSKYIGSSHMSNILNNSRMQSHLTGINGVVRQGLTHLSIPNGWNWGGAASSYCPIWVEIFINSNVGTAL